MTNKCKADKINQKIKLSTISVNDDGVLNSFKESFSTLAVNLIYSVSGKNKKLLITSSSENTGKSTVCINTAISLAKNGQKVLLIEGDLRSPSLAKYLKISGLNDISSVIDNDCEVEQAIVKITDVDNLYVLPSFHKLSNPQHILLSDEYKQLISEVTPLFDWIIFDTPPLDLFADAVIINNYCTSALIVVSTLRSRSNDIKKAAARLGDKVIGVTLNFVDDNRMTKYYSKSTYHYY